MSPPLRLTSGSHGRLGGLKNRIALTIGGSVSAYGANFPPEFPIHPGHATPADPGTPTSPAQATPIPGGPVPPAQANPPAL